MLKLTVEVMLVSMLTVILLRVVYIGELIVLYLPVRNHTVILWMDVITGRQSVMMAILVLSIIAMVKMGVVSMNPFAAMTMMIVPMTAA
jgi:hypothetical protein